MLSDPQIRGAAEQVGVPWSDPPELVSLWKKFDVPRQGLERLRALLADLGNPERELKRIIHIAGTNGKGSVLSYCRAALLAQGYLPNVFTSPHLISATERIRVLDRPISVPRMLELLAFCDRESTPVSYFECLTAAMFVAAAQQPEQWTLLEVGLGGRLDATNVIGVPDIAIITPVGLDHQAFLGNDLSAIATEKAGIIKDGGLVVCAPQAEEAERIIVARASEVDARLFLYGRDWWIEHETDSQEGGFRIICAGKSMAMPSPALKGKHQVINAATAALAMRLSEVQGKRSIGDQAIRAGISAAVWPGRLQKIDSGPWRDNLPAQWKVWIDGAHNELGIRALVEFATDKSAGDSVPWIGIATVLKTKDIGSILQAAAKGFSAIYVFGDNDMFHGNQGFVESGAADMESVKFAGQSMAEAISMASAQYSGRTVNLMVMGSLHLAGEVLRQNGITPCNLDSELYHNLRIMGESDQGVHPLDLATS